MRPRGRLFVIALGVIRDDDAGINVQIRGARGRDGQEMAGSIYIYPHRRGRNGANGATVTTVTDGSTIV